MDRKEVREEYERKVCERLREARMTVEEGISVNDVFSVFRDVVTAVAAEVVGYKVCRSRRKGSAWWADKIKEAIEWKKKAYKKMLQRNVDGEIRERRKNEYKSWNRRMKELVKENKMRVDEEFGRKLSEKLNGNKKLFWKDVKREREEESDM